MIAFFLFLKLFAVVILAEDQNMASLSSEPGRRLYYGEPVKIEDVPYFAGLHDCGAVVISNLWVLTASHCVRDSKVGGPMQVWVGGTTYEDSIKVPYDYVLIHPEATNDMCGSMISDIALIRLNTPLQFSGKIKPIKLPQPNSISPRNVVVVGKGQDETGNRSKRLEKLNLVRVSTEECMSSWAPLHGCTEQKPINIERNFICARKEADMPSICYGDSGSPLVSEDTLVGLASKGPINDEDRRHHRCDDNRIGFYVNVASYVPWIKLYTGL